MTTDRVSFLDLRGNPSRRPVQRTRPVFSYYTPDMGQGGAYWISPRERRQERWVRNAGLCSSSWLLVQKEDSRPSAQSQGCFPVNSVCQGGRPPSGTGVHTSRANACDCGVAAGGTVLGGLVAVQGCYFQIPALTSAAQKGKGQELYVSQPTTSTPPQSNAKEDAC